MLRNIPDPSFPSASSISDLVEDIAIEGDGMHDIHVMLLPTFIGCPALDMIAKDVETKVADLSMVSSCKVSWIFDPPWSVDRISDSDACSCRSMVSRFQAVVSMAGGPQKAIPLMTSAIPCPYCGSTETSPGQPLWAHTVPFDLFLRCLQKPVRAYEAGQPVRLRALLQMHLS